MPYEFYKTIHVVSIMLLFLSFGGLVVFGVTGNNDHPTRKIFTIAHGVALALILVAGFGLLARLKMNAGSPWVIGKVLVWCAFGGALSLVKRKGEKGPIWFALAIGAGTLAGVLAVLKPGAS